MIEVLSATGRDEIELRLRAPDIGFPISEKALYMPPPPRSSPKTRFERPRRDPYLKAYVAATTAFDNMVRVTPAHMVASSLPRSATRPGFTPPKSKSRQSRICWPSARCRQRLLPPPRRKSVPTGSSSRMAAPTTNGSTFRRFISSAHRARPPDAERPRKSDR